MRVRPSALAPQSSPLRTLLVSKGPVKVPVGALLLGLMASCVTPPPAGGHRYADSSAPASDDYGRPPGSYSAPYRGDESPYVRDASYQRGSYDAPERVPPHEAGRYERAPYGRIAFMLGRRSLDDVYFESPVVAGAGGPGSSVDDPGVVGIEFSQIPAPGMLGFEFGVQFANARENDQFNRDTELSQAELYLGARAEFGRERVRPYIGGGGVLLSSTLLQESGTFATDPEVDDTAFGGYLHGGIQFDVSDYMFLGVDYRRVFGQDYNFDGIDVDSSYGQLSVVLGLTL